MRCGTTTTAGHLGSQAVLKRDWVADVRATGCAGLMCRHSSARTTGLACPERALDRQTGQETEAQVRYEQVAVRNGSTDGTQQVGGNARKLSDRRELRIQP